MVWRVEISETARKQIKALERKAQVAIVSYLRERVLETGNPRKAGKALKGNFGDLWRYRVGDYRIVCEIMDEVVTVLVVRVGHRRNIYK